MTTLPLLARFTVGLAALVLTGAFATIGVGAATGAYDDVVEVTLVVDGAAGQGLDRFSDVRVRGVRVGSVRDIALADDGRAGIRLGLDPDLDLPASTVAAIEPLSVFGPKSVELRADLDDAGPRLADGDVIAAQAPPTELSELIAAATDILDAVDAEQLRTVQRALAEGRVGRGGSIRQGLDAADELTTVLARRDDDAEAVLGDLQRLTTDLRGEGATAVAAARSLADGLPVVAETETSLASFLDDGTRLAGDLGVVLDANRDQLRPLLDGLDRTARLLGGRLDETRQFLGVFESVFYLVVDAAQLPGPGDTTQAGIDTILDEDLCQLVEVLCRDLPEPLDGLVGELLDLRDLADLIAQLTGLLSLGDG